MTRGSSIGAGKTLETEISHAIGALQDALAAMLRQAGSTWERSIELSRALGLDPNLAWKVSRLIDEPLAMHALGYLPGDNGFELVLKAGKRKGVEERLIERARSAYASVCAAIERHAGDRVSMEVLLAAGGSQESPTALQMRRSGFLGQSAILGVQVRVHYLASLITPSADANRIDLITTKAMVGLRRTRAGAPCVLGSLNVFDAQGRATINPGVPRAIDPEDAPAGEPTIKDFWSDPAPQSKTILVTHEGVEVSGLVDGPVGNTGLATWVESRRVPSIHPWVKDEQNRTASFGARMFVPAELFVIDAFVHESLPSQTPELRAFNMMFGSMGFIDDSEPSRLPRLAQAESLGRGIRASRLREYDRCRDLNEHVFRRTGLKPEEYLFYRARIDYPPTPSYIEMKFDLPG